MSAARILLLGVLGAALLGGAALAQTAPPPLNLGPPPPPAARPAMSEGIAAVVNDDIISTYDLRQRVLLVMVLNGVQATPQNIAQLEKESLRQLVDEKLEMQEIRSIETKQKDLHFAPSQKELDEELDSYAQQYGVKRPQLIKTLNSAGVELKTLTDQISTSMAWRNYIGGRFHSTVRIGDERVSQEQSRLNAAASKTQYQVSEILVDASRVGGQQQALAGAQQLLAQIKQGAPFQAVARQFSALPTAANGGDAGWLSAGEMPPVIENALANMRVGQVSDPIPVAEGVYILQLREKHAGAGATLVSLKQAAIRIPEQATEAQISDAMGKLTKLRSEVRSCDDIETDAAKLDGVVAGDLGETEETDLSPEFRQVVDKLKVGQVGGPVRTKAGLHLVALCGRRATGGTTPTRDEIENRLANEQLSMISRRYLRDLRTSATIESR
jgi:peptidyl-prolyl cis-trans isomerase SurA